MIINSAFYCILSLFICLCETSPYNYRKVNMRIVTIDLNNTVMNDLYIKNAINALNEVKPDLLVIGVYNTKRPNVKKSPLSIVKEILDIGRNNEKNPYCGYLLVSEITKHSSSVFIYKNNNSNIEVKASPLASKDSYFINTKKGKRGAIRTDLIVNKTAIISLVSANFDDGLINLHKRIQLYTKIYKNLLWNNKAHYTFYYGTLNYSLDYYLPKIKNHSIYELLKFYERLSSKSDIKNYNMFKYTYPMIFNYNNDKNDDNNKEIYKEILGSYDQLVFSRSNNYGFKDYIEPEITFKPNYNMNIIDKENYHVPYYKSRILYKTASSNIDPLIKITNYNLLNNREQLYKITPLMMDAIIFVPLVNNKHKNLSIYSTMRYKELKLKILLDEKEIKSINNDRDISSLTLKLYKPSKFNSKNDESIYMKNIYFIKNISNQFEFIISIKESYGILTDIDKFLRFEIIFKTIDNNEIIAESIFAISHDINNTHCKRKTLDSKNDAFMLSSDLVDKNGIIIGKLNIILFDTEL